MANTLELSAYAVVNYLPYMFLALYPFRSVLRYSKKKTIVLLILTLLLDVAIFTVTSSMSSTMHTVGTYMATLTQLILYFVTVKSRPGRMIYYLFMITNAANYVTILAKYVEHNLFPSLCTIPYKWSNTLCMALLLLVLIPLFMKFLDEYFNKGIRDAISQEQWRSLWLIPVHYYIIWIYLFYYGTEQEPIELAMSGSFILFMTLYIAAQMFVNACIAKLVLKFSENSELQEKNLRLEEQSMQYHAIQNRIFEITSIKHDMRHHLNTLSMYANAGEYEKLKDYLAQYAQQFPEGRIQHCANACLNMLAVYYDERCARLNVPIEFNFRIPEEIGLSDSEISVLFGNLLENAVDATSVLSEGQRSVKCNVAFLQNNLIASITNTCANSLNLDKDGLILSTKHEGHGIGTNSARKITEEHNGSIHYVCKDNVFTVDFTIPIKKR